MAQTRRSAVNPGGQFADGTPGAAERLLDSRAAFLGYIRKRISDPDLAQDILQDCLLKAIRSAPALRDEEMLVHWFYRVLQNAVIDAYRSRAAEIARNQRYQLEAQSTYEPEDEKRICECLNALLPTLKPEYAEVSASIEIQGEDPAAVAKRLGISRENLKVRLHRARRALRKRLEESCRMCAVHHCLDCTCKQDPAHAHPSV